MEKPLIDRQTGSTFDDIEEFKDKKQKNPHHVRESLLLDQVPNLDEALNGRRFKSSPENQFKSMYSF
jgi:hypothetical protein